jgi:hypothetical protein
MESVYSAVRTGYLNKAVCTCALKGFYNRDENCLQRGTDWIFKQKCLRFVFKGLKKINHTRFMNHSWTYPLTKYIIPIQQNQVNSYQKLLKETQPS